MFKMRGCCLFSDKMCFYEDCVCVCVCLNTSSQTLQVRIINVEEYEKQENFFIRLEDPKWLKRGLSGKSISI